MADENENQPPQKKGISQQDLDDAIERLKTNLRTDDKGVGSHLFAENAELRADKRALKKELEELQDKVPVKGQLVLSPADAKVFTDMKAILATLPADKQTPEEVTRLLKERSDLSDKVVVLEKNQLAIQIAESEDWKASTLMTLTKDKDLVVEEVEEEVDDPENEGEKKTVKVNRGFVVTSRDDKGAVTAKKRLSEELAEFLPVLAKEQGNGTAHKADEEGTTHVRQSRGDKAPSKKSNLSQKVLGKYSVPEHLKGNATK
jgi:hypothetical protein